MKVYTGPPIKPCLSTVWSTSVSDIHLGSLLNMNHLLSIPLSSSAHRYETTVNYVDFDVLITDDKVVNVKYYYKLLYFLCSFSFRLQLSWCFFSLIGPLKYFCRISSIFFTPLEIQYAVFLTPPPFPRNTP